MSRTSMVVTLSHVDIVIIAIFIIRLKIVINEDDERLWLNVLID